MRVEETLVPLSEEKSVVLHDDLALRERKDRFFNCGFFFSPFFGPMFGPPPAGMTELQHELRKIVEENRPKDTTKFMRDFLCECMTALRSRISELEQATWQKGEKCKAFRRFQQSIEEMAETWRKLGFKVSRLKVTVTQPLADGIRVKGFFKVDKEKPGKDGKEERPALNTRLKDVEVYDFLLVRSIAELFERKHIFQQALREVEEHERNLRYDYEDECRKLERVIYDRAYHPAEQHSDRLLIGQRRRIHRSSFCCRLSSGIHYRDIADGCRRDDRFQKEIPDI